MLLGGTDSKTITQTTFDSVKCVKLSNTSVYKKLTEINEMSRARAESMFLDCSGSGAWAHAMTLARPYRMLEQLFEMADNLWAGLSNAEKLESYFAETDPGGLPSSNETTISELLETFRLYRDRFGFIFILHTSGRPADEVLAICRARLGNSVESELAIAAAEQRKIMEFRLTQFLEE